MTFRILFVCHGNICRSPMAEFITKDMVRKRGLSEIIYVESCATSNEEIGNDIYPPAKRALSDHGIPFEHRRARRITSADYDAFDLIIPMDRYNVANMHTFVKEDPDKKVRLMMSYLGTESDVKDPWYSGDYEGTFRILTKACSAMLDSLQLDG